MAANATGGSGGRSAYNSQVVTLQENAETGVQPFVEVTYTSATQGGGQTQTIKTTISGSQSKSMTVQSDTVGIQTVRCIYTQPTQAINKVKQTLPNEENKTLVQTSLNKAFSLIDKAVKKNVLHKNNGANRKSKINNFVKTTLIAK